MKLLRLVLYTSFLLVFVQAFYTGIVTAPTEVDSVSYHLPMAKRVLDGSIMNPRSFNFPNPTYPGSTEIVLSAFMAMHIPLNLFNVVAWCCLVVMAYLLGRRCGLMPTISLLFSASIVFLPTIIRLLPTQTADLWLDVFFLWTIYLLLKPQSSWRYFLFLGVAIGMVVGAKFSGPLFVVVALVIYGKSVLKHITFKRLIIFIIPFSLLGASWYFRNWVYYGNPLYPSPIPFFPGVENFSRYMQPHWRTLIFYPGGLMQTINAWLSEYLIWAVTPISSIYLVIKVKDKKLRKLLIFGFFCFFVYLILPGYPFNYNNIVSEVRYGHPAQLIWIMVLYIIFQTFDVWKYAVPVLLMNIIFFFLPFPYRPKFYIAIELIIIACSFVVYLYRKRPQSSFSKE